MVIYLKTKCPEIAIGNTYWPTIPIRLPPIAAVENLEHNVAEAALPVAGLVVAKESNALHNKYVR